MGKAARNGECYDAIVATLKRLQNDETLLVQSGKPVGVFKTHENAPRVLIANANLVPHWATWDEFRRLDALGLTMYGQMTAGSWIYIGTQGILQGTYECFAPVARTHFPNSLRGKLVGAAGPGREGGGERLGAGGVVGGRGYGEAGEQPGGVHRAVVRNDGPPHARDDRAAAPRRDHLRLRQQSARSGEKGGSCERIRCRRLRSALHPPAFLRGKGTIPLGRSFRRSERPVRDGRRNTQIIS